MVLIVGLREPRATHLKKERKKRPYVHRCKAVKFRMLEAMGLGQSNAEKERIGTTASDKTDKTVLTNSESVTTNNRKSVPGEDEEEDKIDDDLDPDGTCFEDSKIKTEWKYGELIKVSSRREALV